MPFNTFLKPLIFQKKIGVKSVTTTSPKNPEFHFILAFAVEERTLMGKGTGKFSPSWNVKDFSAEKIKKLKSEYENVKVVISIGGRGTKYAFYPQDKKKWIDNAKNSLENIIEHDYRSSTREIVIDGIDITYEWIKSDGFVECMAEVMKYLKMKGLKVSIALSSFPAKRLSRVCSIHENLYKDNKDIIDWFDYKLYPLLKPGPFCVGRILAGFSTDPNNTGNISLDVFLKNCRKPKIQSPRIKNFGDQRASSSNLRNAKILAGFSTNNLNKTGDIPLDVFKNCRKPTNPDNSSSHGTPSQTPKFKLKSMPKLRLELKSPPKLQLKSSLTHKSNHKFIEL